MSQMRQELAVFSCLIAAGAITAGFTAKNCTVVRTGAGVYTATLSALAVVNEDQSSIQCTPHGATAVYLGSITHTSDTVKVFNFLNAAGVATDPGSGMDFVVSRITGVA